jgi:hypothetical protein
MQLDYTDITDIFKEKLKIENIVKKNFVYFFESKICK